MNNFIIGKMGTVSISDQFVKDAEDRWPGTTEYWHEAIAPGDWSRRVRERAWLRHVVKLVDEAYINGHSPHLAQLSTLEELETLARVTA